MFIVQCDGISWPQTKPLATSSPVSSPRCRPADGPWNRATLQGRDSRRGCRPLLKSKWPGLALSAIPSSPQTLPAPELPTCTVAAASAFVTAADWKQRLVPQQVMGGGNPTLSQPELPQAFYPLALGPNAPWLQRNEQVPASPPRVPLTPNSRMDGCPGWLTVHLPSLLGYRGTPSSLSQR